VRSPRRAQCTLRRLQVFNQKLLSIGRELGFRKGERLTRQGEPSRGAFVIQQGEVEAQVALPGGGTLTVAELRGGDIFGETALVERGLCMASVVARTNVTGWFIERAAFRALVASRDAAALEIHKAVTEVLSEKLRAANARLRAYAAAEDRAAQPFVEAKRRKPDFEWRRFLPLLPFFEGFDRDEMDELVEGCAAFELPRGAALFRAGEAAQAAFLVIRGAVEIVLSAGTLERRIAIAGPGELVGYRALLERSDHWSSARVREPACLLELRAAQLLRHYEGTSGTSVSLQHALHRSLLQALARTNAQLARLISHARLNAAHGTAADLEQALDGQIILSSN